MRCFAVGACCVPVLPLLREAGLREGWPGEVLVRVEDDPVVLRPVVLVVDDAAGVGSVYQYLNARIRCSIACSQPGVEVVAVAVPEVHQVQQVEVGRVHDAVDPLHRRAEVSLRLPRRRRRARRGDRSACASRSSADVGSNVEWRTRGTVLSPSERGIARRSLRPARAAGGCLSSDELVHVPAMTAITRTPTEVRMREAYSAHALRVRASRGDRRGTRQVGLVRRSVGSNPLRDHQAHLLELLAGDE